MSHTAQTQFTSSHRPYQPRVPRSIQPGSKNDFTARPSSMIPYAAPRRRMLGHPVFQRTAVSRMTRTPAAYSQIKKRTAIGFSHSRGGVDPESISARTGERRTSARSGRRFEWAPESAMVFRVGGLTYKGRGKKVPGHTTARASRSRDRRESRESCLSDHLWILLNVQSSAPPDRGLQARRQRTPPGFPSLGTFQRAKRPSIDRLQFVDFLEGLVHRDPMDDVHTVPLDEAAFNDEVSNCLHTFGSHDRIAPVLGRDNRSCKVLDPEPLGELRHVWRPIQEKLSNRLVGSRTLIRRMRCYQSELLHFGTPRDREACEWTNTFSGGSERAASHKALTPLVRVRDLGAVRSVRSSRPTDAILRLRMPR